MKKQEWRRRRVVGSLSHLISQEDVQLAVGGGRSARCVSRSCLTSGCAFFLPFGAFNAAVGASAELRAIKTARMLHVKSAAKAFQRDNPRRRERSAGA